MDDEIIISNTIITTPYLHTNKFEQWIFWKYNKYSRDIPLFFNQLKDDLEYIERQQKKGNGQLKLLLRELFFFNEIISYDKDIFNKPIIILYIGSAPGNHIVLLYKSLKNYMNIEWHLYDPHKHNKNLIDIGSHRINRMKIHNRLFTETDIIDYIGKDIILISDIRRSPENKEPSSSELLQDYKLQNSIVLALQPKYCNLKWRCLFPDDFTEFDIINGLECLQIYNKSDSAELNIISTPPYTLRTITSSDSYNYERKMFYYNNFIRIDNFEINKTNFILSNIVEELKVGLGINSSNENDKVSYIIGRLEDLKEIK